MYLILDLTKHFYIFKSRYIFKNPLDIVDKIKSFIIVYLINNNNKYYKK